MKTSEIAARANAASETARQDEIYASQMDIAPLLSAVRTYHAALKRYEGYPIEFGGKVAEDALRAVRDSGLEVDS